MRPSRESQRPKSSDYELCACYQVSLFLKHFISADMSKSHFNKLTNGACSQLHLCRSDNRKATSREGLPRGACQSGYSDNIRLYFFFAAQIAQPMLFKRAGQFGLVCVV